MNGKSSKSKGSSFERKTCKQLSLWLSRGLREDLFWRSAMSGGRATVQLKRGGRNRTQLGDITSIDPQGDRLTSKYFVECKHYRDLCILGLMNIQVTNGISRFWDIAVTESKKAGLLPMLIAKQNNKSTIIVLSTFGVDNFMGGMAEDNDRIAHFPLHDAHLFWFDWFVSNAARP